MQEILFRGFHKQADGPDVAIIDGVVERGKWLYGDFSYHTQDGIPYVFPADGYDSADFYEVIPSTVGQYTGLTDKNGKKIFVGDTVRLVYDGTEYFYEVVWDVEELDYKATNGHENYGRNFQYMPCCEEVESTGTIYDAPTEGIDHV